MPKLVDLKQGSLDWLLWRHEKITASMAPVIMGVSKWTKAIDLFHELTSDYEEKDSTYPMRRGKLMEAEALYNFNQSMFTNCIPVCMEHDTIDWLAASMDGWDEEHKILVEIKCPGVKDHETAVKGDIPIHYLPQLVHQMIVANVDTCFYYSYHQKLGSICLEVKKDEAYATLLLQALTEFKRRIREFDPPE